MNREGRMDREGYIVNRESIIKKTEEEKKDNNELNLEEDSYEESNTAQ